MKKIALSLVAIASFLFASQAFAHVSYRSLDVYNPYTMSVTSDHGWAAGANGLYGDSHDIRWFSFNLATASNVTISVANAGLGTFTNYNSSNAASGTFDSIGNIDAGFSVYSGAFPTGTGAAFEGATWDHDNDVNTPKVLTYSTAANAPAGSTGLFNAFGNVTLGNNFGVITTVNYLGHVNDFTGTATESLTLNNLGPGFYSIAVGGASAGGTNTGTYAVTASMSVQPVPVPGAVWLFGSAIAGMVGFGRRKIAA